MKRMWLMIMILCVFGLSSCGLTGPEILHNTLIGSQLTVDAADMMKSYPKVVKIIEKHKDEFSEEELSKLIKSKELIDYAIVELMKLRNIRSLSTIPDLSKLYRDLMFIWEASRKVYETNASIILGKYENFTTMEMLAINDLDSTMRDVDFNLKLLFEGGEAAFNESKAKEILPILMNVVKVVATISVVI